MLKTIAAVSPELTQFVEGLQLPLNTPQHRHITQIADDLVTTQGSKTLSAVYRHIVGDPCSKSAADTFREALTSRRLGGTDPLPLPEYSAQKQYDTFLTLELPNFAVHNKAKSSHA